MQSGEYSISGDVFLPNTARHAQFFKCIWYVEGFFPRGQRERILPSGVAELIFNLSEPMSFYRAADDLSGCLPRCFINGINVNDITLVKRSHQHLVGVQLYPYAIKTLFGVPANELTNNVIDLTLLSKKFDALWHMVAERPDFSGRIAIVLNWFDEQFRQLQTLDEHRVFAHFYDTAHKCRIRIRQLAGSYCMSERSLRRKCNEWLGMSAESMLQYRKYLESLALLHVDDLSLTQIGFLSGYYDQSHFIREFRAFTSLTPGAYREQKSVGIGHIFMEP